MGSNIIELPVVWSFDKSAGLTFGGIQWYWTDELGAYTESRPRIEKIQMKLKKLTGLAYVSDELIEDSPQSVEALIKTGFNMGMNFTLSNALIRGVGAGVPSGFLGSPALITITKEVGQPAATILFENLIKMVARFYGSNGVWLCNKNCLPSLASLSLSVGVGGIPVWLPANGISGQLSSTLFGMPVIFNEHMSTLGTVGDIALCDFSQYWVGRRAGTQEVKYAESMHVMFLYDQQAMKFSTRLDGQVSWPAAMTPANGDSMSPFVVLETRS
jgi:HK97 family phage major capsid protein